MAENSRSFRMPVSSLSALEVVYSPPENEDPMPSTTTRLQRLPEEQDGGCITSGQNEPIANPRFQNHKS